MSYQFCLGPSGAGKSTELHQWVIRNAQDALRRLDFGQNYLIVVPDQYTMQTQKELVLAAGDAGGIMNVDVLSFGRLSHRIFEETGEDSRAVLDDMGKNLILRRLVGTCKKDLKVLSRQIDRPGMISEVKSVISEFMQYGIGVEDVGKLSDYAAQHGQGSLSARLKDLQILYQAFIEAHQKDFITGEETLDVLAKRIPQSQIVRHSVIVFDGFTGFTPVQYRVLLALMQNAKKVIFAFDYAEDGGTPLEEVTDGAPFEPQDLFYLTRKTVNDIVRLGTRGGVSREADWIVGDSTKVPGRFLRNAPLAHLERSLFRYPVREYVPGGGDSYTDTMIHTAGMDENGLHTHGKDGDVYEGSAGIHLSLCTNPEQEVRQMCIRIRKLMMEKGYSYRDFGIVCGDLPAYEDAIRIMAERYGIPVYIDSNRAVLQNPLTETIRAALEIGGGDFRYETVFRYLRSGLSGLSPDETDRLENYCLARGIRSRKRWETAFDAEFEPLRMRFLDSVEPLMNPAETYAEPKKRSGRIPANVRTRALYAFLTGIRAGEQMEKLSAQYEDAGDTAHAMEYGQIYGAVIHLLDELYELLGSEELQSEEFLELVEAGFEEIRLGVLPQQVDRILVGDMERTRMPEIRVLFFLGVNDGNIPKGTSKGGLISDLDREFLQDADVLRESGGELAPTPRQQMYLQRLYLYMNMTKPSDALYLSWCRTAGDGSSLRPSYLVGLVRQIFPAIVTEIPEEEKLTEQMVCAADASSFLAAGLRDYTDGVYLHAAEHPELNLTEKLAEFESVYGFCAQSSAKTDPAADIEITGRSADRYKTDLGHRIRTLRDAAFYRYQPVPISGRTAERLYGKMIRGSVTRLETAAQCYLRQYLQYGLRLSERDEYVFAPNDSGTILHESVQRFGQILREHGIGWKEYTKEQGTEYVRQALREAAGSYNDQILYAAARSAYQAERLARILARTVDTLQYQLEQGDFLPAALEQSFGEDGSLRFPLDGGREVQLLGRIDRVDAAITMSDRKLLPDGEPSAEEPFEDSPADIFIKILDYKSGNRDLDPKMMKAGIQMQLLLYLLAEEEILKKRYPGSHIVPSAMLYYHFDDPVLGSSDAEEVLREASSCGENAEETELSILRRKLRPRGMVGADPEIITRLDRNLHTGPSMVIPVSILKKGGFSATSHVFTQEELRDMERNLREKICQFAKDILDGRTDANPAILKGDLTACTWCPYRNACGFEVRIPGYTYREIR